MVSQAQESSEGRVTPGGIYEFGGLSCVHARQSKRGVYSLSNKPCTTGVNAVFSMGTMGKSTIEKVLEHARKHDISDVEVAEAFGVPKQNFSNWKRRGMPVAMNQKAADFIGCTLDELVGRASVPDDTTTKRGKMVRSDQIRNLPTRKVPVVGTAQLGDDGFWTELGHPVGSGDGYLDVPSDDRNAYAVRVVGDSMHPRIRSGEFVLIEPNHPYGPGDEVLVVTRDGRSMVKEFLYQRDGQLVLNSVNNGHGRLSLQLDHVDKIHYVAGIVKSARWRTD